MATFAELDIPFPLFEGAAENSDYLGLSTCFLCSVSNRHCFCLSGSVIVPCPCCQTPTGLSSYDRTDELCRNCATPVSFPALPDVSCETTDDELCVCYQCLRVGRAAFTKDTEYGMVTWEHDVQSQTHGVPGLLMPGLEQVAVGNNGDPTTVSRETWNAVRLPSETIWELLRTPGYVTWQGERWQFCGPTAMIYVGEWHQADFARHAPDGDGKTFFYAVFPKADAELWQYVGGGRIIFYLFRCPNCGAYKGHWDMD